MADAAPLGDTPPGFRSGFVGLVGKPNVGKSTILNAYLDRKVSIISSKPQTTRQRILGVLTRDNAQVVFLDSPGWHEPKDVMGRYMLTSARNVMEEADVLVVVLDATTGIEQEDEWVFDQVRKLGHPVLLALNKADAVKKPLMLPLLEQCAAMNLFADLIPMSALRGENLDELLKQIIARLPEGPRWYEAHQLTDQPTEQVIREFIREAALQATRQEVPHSVAVRLDEMTEKERITVIRATILVEREGQKAIIIGKGGLMLKHIGVQARLELERWLGRRVFLELWVKVIGPWRQDSAMLRELGYEG